MDPAPDWCAFLDCTVTDKEAGMNRWLIALIVIALVVVPGVVVFGDATVEVTNIADGVPGSLRDAVISVDDGGTITFDATVTGTIMLQYGHLWIDKNVTIIGPGAAELAVSGDHSSRIFRVGSDGDVSISGLTIRDGSADSGAGIKSDGILTLDACVITDNTATGDGGGIVNTVGNLTIQNSTIADNIAENGCGGGISSFGGTVTLSDSHVSGNTAPEVNGGGIMNRGVLNLFGTSVDGNSSMYGGGIRNKASGRISLEGCSVSDNTAYSGAGIHTDGYVTIDSSTVNGNVATSGSGGIMSSGEMHLSDSTVDGNTAGTSSGGISNGGPMSLTNCSVSYNSATNCAGIGNDGELTLIHVRVEFNTAAESGGGIFNGQGTVAASECLILGNTAQSAGGIRNKNGIVDLTNTVIRDNIATLYSGGGINNSAIFHMMDCIIAANEAAFAGGISNRESSTMTLVNCLVMGNHAEGAGAIGNAGNLTMKYSQVSGNTAITSAGGIDNSLMGILFMDSCTITGNLSSLGGGIGGGGPMRLSNCTISGNRSDDAGAIFAGSTAEIVLDFCTVTDNHADPGVGGGLAIVGKLYVKNTIIAGNTSGGPGPDCYLATANPEAVFVSHGYNLIGDATGCPFTLVLGDQVGTASSPLNPGLGPLADNGGGTLTHALLSDSAAIDAASFTGVPGVLVELDQRGALRPFGPTCDIGAFELERPLDEMYAFSVEHVKLDFKQGPRDDQVIIRGSFDAGQYNANGADLAPVVVVVGPVFEKVMVELRGKSSKCEYDRHQRDLGIIQHLTIDWRNGTFDIMMDGADLAGVENPVSVSFWIGDAYGLETIAMNEKRTHWDYNLIALMSANPALTIGSGIVVSPNPVRDINTATFEVTGPLAADVDEIRVRIFDLAGHLVWEGDAPDTEIDWHTENLYGEYLANGVYIYIVELRIGEAWVMRNTGKLTVLR